MDKIELIIHRGVKSDTIEIGHIDMVNPIVAFPVIDQKLLELNSSELKIYNTLPDHASVFAFLLMSTELINRVVLKIGGNEWELENERYPDFTAPDKIKPNTHNNIFKYSVKVELADDNELMVRLEAEDYLDLFDIETLSGTMDMLVFKDGLVYSFPFLNWKLKTQEHKFQEAGVPISFAGIPSAVAVEDKP
jgi:hypothetical protein